ncbi:MAG: hypothetical protein H0U87_09505 [Acidobacteria bacterium]|nr:hypothetical protein [Acidobacteriota bacterium]
MKRAGWAASASAPVAAGIVVLKLAPEAERATLAAVPAITYCVAPAVEDSSSSNESSSSSTRSVVPVSSNM